MLLLLHELCLSSHLSYEHLQISDALRHLTALRPLPLRRVPQPPRGHNGRQALFAEIAPSQHKLDAAREIRVAGGVNIE